MNDVELFKLIQFDLYDYFNLINGLLCNRCTENHAQQEKRNVSLQLINHFKKFDLTFLGKNENTCSFFGNDYFHVHHSFNLKKYIYSKNITPEIVKNWFEDSDHGYFHGLMTGFISYFLLKYHTKDKCLLELISRSREFFKRDKIASREYFEKKIDGLSKLFFSSIFHDFIKPTFGSENHDSNLINYFPNLTKETFRHKNPVGDDNNKILILSDRIELHRYEDFSVWKDENIIQMNKFSEHQLKYLEIFYDVVRPSLLYFYENRNNFFIKHGLEDEFINVYKEKDIYPKTYFTHLANDFQDNEIINNFAIEIDKFPFKECSNHSGDVLFTFIKGFIKLDETLIEKSNFGYWINEEKETMHDIHFDHLVMNTDQNIDLWTFLHRFELLLDNTRDSDIEFLIKNKIRLTMQNNIYLLDRNILNFEKYLMLFSLI